MSDQNLQVAVQSGAVDTHCHLFLLDRQPPEVVETARAAGVHRLICVGVDAPTSRRSLELADSLGGVFATAGLHPHDASTLDHRMGAELEEMLLTGPAITSPWENAWVSSSVIIRRTFCALM